MAINDSDSLEDERLARKIAEYMLGEFVHNTYSGSNFYSFAEINRIFGTALPADREMVYCVIDAILSKTDVKIHIIEGFGIFSIH